MAAAVITINVIKPKMFESLLLVFSFIIFLLFAMCKTMAIKKGEVNPYRIAV